MCGKRQEALHLANFLNFASLVTMGLIAVTDKFNLIRKSKWYVILWGIQDERIGTATIKQMKRTNRKGCRALNNYILIAARLLSRNSRNTTISCLCLFRNGAWRIVKFLFVNIIISWSKTHPGASLHGSRGETSSPLHATITMPPCRSESPPHQTHGSKENLTSLVSGVSHTSSKQHKKIPKQLIIEPIQ